MNGNGALKNDKSIFTLKGLQFMEYEASIVRC